MSYESRFGRPRMRYLREWREHAGLSQEALARKAGVSTSTISRSERHTVFEPQLSVIRKIEEALEREPFGLETPPPGVPDSATRDRFDFVWVLHTVADAVEGDLLFDLVGEDKVDPAVAFVSWVMAHPVNLQGAPLELPDPEALRDAAGLLERIADAQEEAYEEHRTVQ